MDGAGLAPAREHISEVAAFGFRQRILSPEDAFEDQPSVGGEGEIVSMFDGRLDNRSELLGALRLTSLARAPVPDGELVRAAYEKWGEEAVPRLLGDFAWAVWNGRTGRLMLARDHGRLRALFYCRTKRFVAFATSYRPLLAIPGVTHDLDAVTIAQLLASAPDGSDRSFYKHVRWIGSSMRVIITPDQVRQDRLWQPERREPLRLSSDAEYLEAARSIFDTAVSDRLRLAGPVVSAISGGLDSSAVASTAARLNGQSIIHGLCLVPSVGSKASGAEGRYADERPLVEPLSDRYSNLSVDYLSLTPSAAAAEAAIPFAQLCIPVRAPGNFQWFAQMYQRAAELGSGTLLDGGYGNITFSAGGDDSIRDLIRLGQWRQLSVGLMTPSTSLRLLRRFAGSMAGRSGLLSGKAPSNWQDFTAINPDFVQAFHLKEQLERDWVSTLHRRTRDRASRLQYFTARSRVQAEWIAAQRKLYGVVPSDPFADRRIIEFCLSLPEDQFRRAGMGRLLARRAFADRLTPDIVNNRRKGIQDTDWHLRLSANRAAMLAQLSAMQRSRTVTAILDIPRLRRLVQDLPTEAGVAERDRSFYMQALEMSVHVGQFLQWLEQAPARGDSQAAP